MVSAAIKLKDACPLEGKLTNLDSILNSRDTTLPTKVHLVKGMVFLLVMYRYESWTIKKAEYWCFWTAVLEKTLDSPLAFQWSTQLYNIPAPPTHLQPFFTLFTALQQHLSSCSSSNKLGILLPEGFSSWCSFYLEKSSLKWLNDLLFHFFKISA